MSSVQSRLDQLAALPSPGLIGILNVTPDSFSDAGQYLDRAAAIEHAHQMAAAGAAIIDVGAESTRPGATPVPSNEQIRRAVPVIAAFRKSNEHTAVSIDTTNAAVARAAIDAGADVINDTSALRDDPTMTSLVASRRCGVILMHRRGMPIDMQRDGGPVYSDVVAEVCGFLTERRNHSIAAGIPANRIWLDPGIGFGKRHEDNIRLVRATNRLLSLGSPVVMGVSRKRFLGTITGMNDPALRDAASVSCVLMMAQAAMIAPQHRLWFRVHNVNATSAALKVWQDISPMEK